MRGIDSREVNPASDVMRAPDPYGATSPGEFVNAMRALKEWSGLTYRQLQRRAAAVDELLPHSTIAAALSRNTLPREDLVTGFVRACGQDEATAAGWLTVRKRIAAGLPVPAAVEATPDSGTDEPSPATAVAEPAEVEPVDVEPVEVSAAVVVPEEEPAADDGPPPGDATEQESTPDRAGVEPAVPSFASGTLASTVARRKKDEWVGTHRYDPAVDVPRPAGLRWLVPPIMYRTGWATRVLSAGIVVVLVFVAAAVTVRIIREVGGDDPGAIPSTLAEAPEGDEPAETGDALDDGAGGVTPPAPTTGPTPTPAPGSAPAQPQAKTPTPKPTTPKPAPTTAAAPAPANGNPGTFAGVYRIRPAHTGLCVGEGPELYKSSGRTVLGQQSCGSAGPPTILERVSGSVYRIKLDHPTHGIGCATVDEGAAGDGLLVAGANCGASRKDQQFTLEPVSTPAAGHRIRSVAGGSYCIGVYNGSDDVGVQLIQTRCDGGKHQVFAIEAR
ncbi:hypothetical protein [Micromonospora sp. NPDC004704]